MAEIRIGRLNGQAGHGRWAATSPLDRAFDRRAAAGPNIRGRHTRSTMYEDEFDKIWAAQRQYYPDILTEKFKYGSRGQQRFPKKPEPLGGDRSLADQYGIHGLIFFQRKMYWPRSVVGRCELEPREKRCPRAAREAQRFRIPPGGQQPAIVGPRGAERAPPSSGGPRKARPAGWLCATRQATFDQMRSWLKLAIRSVLSLLLDRYVLLFRGI